jgi:hypothetical protein
LLFAASAHGAPIDIAAGNSKLSDLANNTPSYIFRELVQLGDGRMLGQRLLQWWMQDLDRNEIYHLLGSSHAIDSMAFRRLETRFQRWYAWTVNLPGTYYLQVVEQTDGVFGSDRAFVRQKYSTSLPPLTIAELLAQGAADLGVP